MSLFYTIERFTRSVRPDVLRMYLRVAIPDADLSEADDPRGGIQEILNRLPEQKQRRFHADASDLYRLWQDPDILQREGELPEDVQACLPPDYSGYSVSERVLWLAVHAPEWIGNMIAWQRARRSVRCHWLTRRILLGTPARAEYPRMLLDRFSFEVSRYVSTHEKCGRIYRIQYYRDAWTDSEYFLLTLSAQPSPLEQWTPDGELEETIVRKTFDIIFVYRPSDGLLSVRAPGSTPYKLGLCTLWAKILHGVELDEGNFIEPRYHLEKFLSHNGPLYLPSVGPIQYALCVSVKYRLLGSPAGLRVFEDPCGNIGDAIRNELNREYVPYDLMDVQGVRLKFMFAPGVRRHRHVTIDVSKQHAGINSVNVAPYLKRSMEAALEEWGVSSFGFAGAPMSEAS